MKNLIFLTMVFLVFTNADVFAKTVEYDMFNKEYSKVFSNDEVYIFSAGLFAIKSKAFISNDFKEFESKFKKRNNFIDRVIICLNYKF